MQESVPGPSSATVSTERDPGNVVCGLFASLMSTLDSIFHAVSTLWSIDIYKRYLQPDASPRTSSAWGNRPSWAPS